MGTIKPQENQNIFDIALQEYGSLEGVFNLLEDNNLTELTQQLSVYDDFNVLQDPVRRDIVEFYSSRSLRPASQETLEELKMLKTNTQGTGLGFMAIGGDFIVAPGPKVVFSGVIMNPEGFGSSDFQNIARAFEYAVYNEDNTTDADTITSFEIVNIENDTIDFTISISLGKRYKVFINYQKLGLAPSFSFESPFSNNIFDSTEIRDNIELGNAFEIEIKEEELDS